MSATNRDAIRVENDFYETPSWLTEAIIPYLPRSPARILEPACGSGAIVRVLEKSFPESIVIRFDIDPKHGDGVVDFLKAAPQPDFDLIVTNPPFKQAREFIETALRWRRDETSIVCMLLRLNFLEGQDRAAWIRANIPSVYVTPRRPSFTGGGSDATGYAWMMWDGKPPRLVILDTELRDRSLNLFK